MANRRQNLREEVVRIVKEKQPELTVEDSPPYEGVDSFPHVFVSVTDETVEAATSRSSTATLTVTVLARNMRRAEEIFFSIDAAFRGNKTFNGAATSYFYESYASAVYKQGSPVVFSGAQSYTVNMKL